jgi:lipoprotein-anchoring transpeptidase ErfK/SrfK
MSRPGGIGPVQALVAIGLLLVAAGCTSVDGSVTTGATPDPAVYTEVVDDGVTIPAVPQGRLDPRYVRRVVTTPGNIPNEPGTIVVDTRNRYLYLVQADGNSIRYGIGVGREGFAWSGEATIKDKQHWPRWIPPKEMVARDPNAAPWANGMPGGRLDNPLGARAMYLYEGNKDTLYRLHGTNDAASIGKAVSSGCVRLLNQDVIDLYNRVPLGTKVVVLGDSYRGVPFVEYLFPGVSSAAPTPPKNVGQL